MSVRRLDRGDVSEVRWALIEPVFTVWRTRRTGPGKAARVHDLREIVNAILVTGTVSALSLADWQRTLHMNLPASSCQPSTPSRG